MMNIYIELTGNDTTGDGSKALPFRTLTKAMTAITSDCNVYFGKGIHCVNSLVEMSNSSYIINYFGHGYDTILEIQYYYESAVGAFKNKMTINNFTIRPSNNFYCINENGWFRVLSYTADACEVIFNYCLFTKSLNGNYPNSCLFYFHNNEVNFACNKHFNNCTFISPGYPVVQVGLSYYNKCTTNVASLSSSSLSAIEDSLANQTYNSDYTLTETYLNKTYGVYSGWAIKMLILVNDSEYYTLDSYQNLVKANYDIHNAFTKFEFANIDLNKFKEYTPFKFVLFEDKDHSNNYKTLNYYINNFNAFILLKTESLNLRNIKFKIPHKMLVSDDLKTWYNYYDEKVSNIHIDDYEAGINRLKKYIRENSKAIDHIDKSYKYILLQLNSGETLNKLYEIIEANYKRIDPDIVKNTGAARKISITVPVNTSEIIVKLLSKDSIIIQDSIGEWQDGL